MRQLFWAIALLACGCAHTAQVSPQPPANQHLAAVTAPDAAQRAPETAAAPSAPAPTRIAFGSCNELQKPQRLWDAIATLAPSAFVWLGDIVYADTEDDAARRAMYDALRAHPGYAALRARTTILGTWDDHDYGRDNAGREHPKRAESQQAFLDFLDEPADSTRRTQEGVYASYDLGQDPYRVRVILLDLRYHRDKPGPASDMLGEAQWAWLRTQLEGSTAAVHVLGSSTQVVADQHGYDKWADYPADRARLLALLDETRASNVVVLSGDRHFGELSRLDRGPSRPVLYDLTSSSMSKPWSQKPSEDNRHRVGVLVWDVNFGVLEIDWSTQAPTLRLQLHTPQGVELDESIPLASPLAHVASAPKEESP